MTSEIWDKRHNEINAVLMVSRQRVFCGELWVGIFQEHTEFWDPLFIPPINL